MHLTQLRLLVIEVKQKFSHRTNKPLTVETVRGLFVLWAVSSSGTRPSASQTAEQGQPKQQPLLAYG